MLQATKFFRKNNYVSLLSLLIAFMAGLVSISLVLPYYISTPTLPISQDSLHEFLEWTRGENIWGKLRHNGAASLFVGITLALDIYVGPYGLWLRIIQWMLMGVFFVSVYKASKPYLRPEHLIAWFALFFMFWFFNINASASYFYQWKITEAASQLAALGLSIFIISNYSKLSLRVMVALIFVSQLFAYIHLGYVTSILLFVSLMYLDERKPQRTVISILFVIYILFMTLVDGTFVNLVSRLFGESSGEVRSVQGLIISYLDLSTLSIDRFFGAILPGFIIVIMKVCLGLLLLGFGLISAYKFFKNKSIPSAIFLNIVGFALGSILLAVIGRYGLYGAEVVNQPRYFSYALIVFFAVFWMLLTYSHKREYTALFGGVILFSFGLTHYKDTKSILRTSAIFSQYHLSNLNSYYLSDFKYPNMHRATPKDSETYKKLGNKLAKPAFFSVDHGVIDDVARFLGSDVQQVQYTSCKGRFPRKENLKDYSAVDFVSAPYADKAWDYILAVSDKKLVAITPKYLYKGKLYSRLYIPNDTKSTKIYIIEAAGENEFSVLCQMIP